MTNALDAFTPEQVSAAIAATALGMGDEGRERERLRTFIDAGQPELIFPALGVYSILTTRLGEAIHELERLARKAQRYGTGRITWTMVGEHRERRRTASGRSYTVELTDVHVEGDTPRVGDYKFLARGEITPGGVIVDTVPGAALPAGARELMATGECQHCHNKRQRRDVFLVQDPAGQLVQVGRTCLRDYLGTDTPGGIAARFRFERELRELSDEWCGGRGSGESALELLAVTSAAIRLWGWVPKSAPESSGQPTASAIGCWFYVHPGDDAGREQRRALEEALGDSDWDEAQATLEWVASPDAGDSDYIENLRVILGGGMVEARRRGYACSAVAARQRYLGRLALRRRERAAAAESQWVGREGERLRGLELTLLSNRSWTGAYGLTVLYKFADKAGNRLAWFSSGGADLDVGRTYLMDATVKAHSEHEGARETQLTRARVLDERSE